jgi:hypothetical protein
MTQLLLGAQHWQQKQSTNQPINVTSVAIKFIDSLCQPFTENDSK